MLLAALRPCCRCLLDAAGDGAACYGRACRRQAGAHHVRARRHGCARGWGCGALHVGREPVPDAADCCLELLAQACQRAARSCARCTRRIRCGADEDMNSG